MKEYDNLFSLIADSIITINDLQSAIENVGKIKKNKANPLLKELRSEKATYTHLFKELKFQLNKHEQFEDDEEMEEYV